MGVRGGYSSVVIEYDTMATPTSMIGLGNVAKLTGCKFKSCKCEPEYYLSGNACTKCKDKWAGSDDRHHTNTSCGICAKDYVAIKSGSAITDCQECPDHGTCHYGDLSCDRDYYAYVSGGWTCKACESGATTYGAGATSHTQCCYDVNHEFDDKIKGRYNFKSTCCYTN